jgi:hypothetical protein
MNNLEELTIDEIKKIIGDLVISQTLLRKRIDKLSAALVAKDAELSELKDTKGEPLQ